MANKKKLYPPKPHIWIAKFDTSKDTDISSTTKIWSTKTSTVVVVVPFINDFKNC